MSLLMMIVITMISTLEVSRRCTI